MAADTDPAQQARDAEHLRLLSIFHYIAAAIIAVLGCIPIIHLIVGLVIFVAEPGDAPRWIGLLFALVGGFMVAMSWTLAILLVTAGNRLKQRSNRSFCVVVAAVSCLFMPVGTVLGVFTLIVLHRPSVERTFDQPNPGRAFP
jgi:hypothetical protein